MSKYWNENTKELRPYVPGEQPKDQKYIKLNTNENPYPPSPRVLDAAKAALDWARLYPDPDCNILRDTCAQYYKVRKDQVFAGNGSDELLALAFKTFFGNTKPILFPDITYTFYPVYCDLMNIPFRTPALCEDFTVPMDEFTEFSAGGIVLPNPNAPTGILMGLDDIAAIARSHPECVVLIDEAYIDFGGETAVPLIDEHANLLVVKTLSKSRSLAGLRLAVAIGNAELIKGLEKVKNSFNSYTVDTVALAAGAEAFRDEIHFNKTRKSVICTRERIAGQLINMGFTVTDSKANFLFISHRNINAKYIFTQLRSRGILVRHFELARIENYLRVTIGTDNDMDTFLSVLKDIIQENEMS